MKKLFYFLLIVVAWSCNKVHEQQMPPVDKELFNPAMDREVAAKKGGHGNPHNIPDDPQPPVTPPPVDTTTKKVYILLDFNAQTVSSPYWNGGIPFTINNSGLDAPGQAEALATMRTDYSFNTNITIGTSEAEYFSYPADKRQRIIFTTDWQWYGYVGGVAYVNGMSWGVDVPAFVFTSLLGNAFNAGKAGTHEAGHGFGCRHDKDWIIETCEFRGEYEPFKNMGNGYYYSSVWGKRNLCGDGDDIETINNSVNQ